MFVRTACIFLVSYSTSDFIFMHLLVSILDGSNVVGAFICLVVQCQNIYTRSRTSLGHNIIRVQIQLKLCSALVRKNCLCTHCPEHVHEPLYQQQQQLLFMKFVNIFGIFFHHFTSIKCTIQTYVWTFHQNTFAWHGIAKTQQISFFMYNNYISHLKFYYISYFRVINAIICRFNSSSTTHSVWNCCGSVPPFFHRQQPVRVKIESYKRKEKTKNIQLEIAFCHTSDFLCSTTNR